MPQNANAATIATNLATKSQTSLATDGNKIALVSDGLTPVYNLTAAAVIKATPGRLAKLIVIAGGTASNGAFTLNDCATTGAAAIGNEIITIPSGTAVGTIYNLGWPCLTGIVLSAVPSAGSPILALIYT